MPRNLGVLGDSTKAPIPVRIVEDPPPPPGVYPVRPGYHRKTDTYPYFRWQPPVPFRDAIFPPPPASGVGAYYQDPVVQAVSGLGQACGPCQITSGGQCVPCPDGFDAPECANCAGGQPVQAELSWMEKHPFWGPVMLSATAIVLGSLAVAYVSRGK